MFRQVETNIKWMLTLSLLFHLTLLSIIFSSGIFKRSTLFTSRQSPFTSIQVNIVNLPRDSRPAMSAPSSGNSKVEKTVPDVKKKEPVIEKKTSNQLTKIERLRENRGMPSPDSVLTAPVKKDTSEIKTGDTAARGSQSAGSRSDDGADTIGGSHQESRLIGGDSNVSGPVVDMPSFKYDYYLGLIKSKVDNRWSQPVVHNKTRKALIEFTISRQGDVSNVRVADSSGDSYFDQTALRAVTLSTPFPPLPRGYKGDSLKVHYRFIFGEKI
ncbi:MAG: TonB family protein [Nitrospirae bacterium]|nr:TonB family protein [Nitrospirota bacterium]